MGNNQKGKSALIVEGSSDSNLFFLITDSSCCRIITAEGKDNVLNAMSIIRSQRYPGVLALVDADFDHLNNSVVASDDVEVDICMNASTTIGSSIIRPKDRVISSSRLDCAFVFL